MRDDEREVTIPCPRCGQPFVLAVGRLDVGHEVDVVGWACDCALTEDAYEDLCDAAVAAAEVAERERDALRAQALPQPPSAAPTTPAPVTPAPEKPAQGLWARLRRVFGGD